MNTYVSLTSIKQNEDILLETLKSIKNQTVKPNKCFLYLSENSYLLDEGFENKKIGYDLDDFLAKNSNDFELIWCENIGPYRKLLPLLKEKINQDCSIITIDDDTEYNPDFIENMINDYNKQKCCISYRGFTMKVSKNINELTYEDRSTLKEKYLFNFHTGKGGVLYNPNFFKKTESVIFDREIYLECCETGDDVWFNFMRIANNIDCYVSDNEFMKKDNTKAWRSLFYRFNIFDKLNTLNIKKTIKKLISLNLLCENINY